MKRLILLRHAKAMPPENAGDDATRLLAPRGERDAALMGERLRARGLHPELILTSPAARALRTAQIVAASVDCPADAIVVDAQLYLAAPVEILGVIATVDAHVGSLLIVGHNPGLSEIAGQLTPELAAGDLPTCGLVVLDAPAADWVSIDTRPARLTYYDFPKNPLSPPPMAR